MKYLLLPLLGVSFSLQDEPISTTINTFTPNIYKKILKTHTGNFVTSPLSLEIILSLALSGAKGKTALEMQNILNFPNTRDTIENGIKTLLPKLRSNDYRLHVANKIYVSDDLTLKEHFLKVATEVYASEAETINFRDQAEAANTINCWVEQETENKISDLVSPKELSSDTKAVLVNALFFNGTWSHPFDPEDTRKETFYRNGRDPIKVDMMYNERSGSEFRYYEDERMDVKILELPFKGSDASFTVVLPNQRAGLSRMENTTIVDIVFLFLHMEKELVHVGLPKVKIESKIDFTAVLRNMGMGALFEDGRVDLSAIAGKKGELVISNVIQKSYIDIKEAGVEAAAAGFMEMGVGASLKASEPKPKEFIIDRPFIFYVRVQGAIICAGRVTDPTL